MSNSDLSFNVVTSMGRKSWSLSLSAIIKFKFWLFSLKFNKVRSLEVLGIVCF